MIKRLQELPDSLKFAIVLAAGAVIYGLFHLFSEPAYEPDPLDLEAAISDAYATTTIELAHISYSNNTSDICFTNPRSRDDILSCYLERPTFQFQIEGVDLSCKAQKPRFSSMGGLTVVYVRCFSGEAESHGLPSIYELTSFSVIPMKNYGLIILDSDADENGNFLEPVIFGIEPIENDVPVE